MKALAAAVAAVVVLVLGSIWLLGEVDNSKQTASRGLTAHISLHKYHGLINPRWWLQGNGKIPAHLNNSFTYYSCAGWYLTSYTGRRRFQPYYVWKGQYLGEDEDVYYPIPKEVLQEGRFTVMYEMELWDQSGNHRIATATKRFSTCKK